MIADSHQLQSDCTGIWTIRIALLGCGTVGCEVARLLIDSRERLRREHGVCLHLTRILVRDVHRRRAGIDAALFTTNSDDVLRSDPDLVIEALGGREPARALVRRALDHGIHVVTANKTLIAHDGPELQSIANRSGARLAYEASVGAAIPVLAAMRQRAGDPVLALRAVLNGTCNFILSRMRETGSSLNAVLREAIDRGYAEPDPSADISGRDTAEKLCILARAAGFRGIAPGDIARTGIEHITPRDLDAAAEHGCVVRLVAELTVSKPSDAALRVEPMFVPIAHPLAKARGAENVIVLDQQHAGRLVLQGEGAGANPTAAAILGDVLNVLEAVPANRGVLQATAASTRRVFARLPRTSPATTSQRSDATHVHLRRDAMELITLGDARPDLENGFIASMLE